jgi:hypothetical protein
MGTPIAERLEYAALVFVPLVRATVVSVLVHCGSLVVFAFQLKGTEGRQLLCTPKLVSV